QPQFRRRSPERTSRPAPGFSLRFARRRRQSGDSCPQDATTLKGLSQFWVGGFAGLARSFSDIVVVPRRKEAPSCNPAARTRSSPKNVPLVEARSLRLTNRSRTSSRQ